MPGRTRSQITADERDEQVWQIIDLHDEWWLGRVHERWQENVAAGMVLRPPAFTFPDGTALSVTGRPF